MSQSDSEKVIKSKEKSVFLTWKFKSLPQTAVLIKKQFSWNQHRLKSKVPKKCSYTLVQRVSLLVHEPYIQTKPPESADRSVSLYPNHFVFGVISMGLVTGREGLWEPPPPLSCMDAPLAPGTVMNLCLGREHSPPAGDLCILTPQCQVSFQSAKEDHYVRSRHFFKWLIAFCCPGLGRYHNVSC